MKTRILSFMLLLAIVSFNACDDDEKPKTIPVVNTTTITNVTTTTAVGGGEITDAGNAEITASGLVYSSASTTPTLADSKTEETATQGSFTSNLATLSSGTTYNVRAYATNSVGTGYGLVVTFTTGNAAPVVINTAITGTVQVPEELTATYTYSDAENNAESGTTFQWYKANDGAGSGETVITGATALAYTIQAVDEFKYIRIGITPKSAAGTSPGVEVKSAFVGPVQPEPTTVTFTYNGVSVTYGIIISPVTGRRWLDRNLGAPNTPTAYDDFTNYGDLFQWGRVADGHQLITRNGGTNAETAAVNGVTNTLSTNDTPPNALFIIPTTDPFDWRSPSNDNLWQGVNGTNNPCPSGWRIPTKADWEAENLTDIDNEFAQLKLTYTGIRRLDPPGFAGTAVYGQYWSSTLESDGRPNGFNTDVYFSVDARALGTACRCIRD
jgi:hypothetical protein